MWLPATLRLSAALPSRFWTEFSLAPYRWQATMPSMSSAYEQLLDATIRHLENLHGQGKRHVAVTPETLRALSLPSKSGGGTSPGAVSPPPAPASSRVMRPASLAPA